MITCPTPARSSERADIEPSHPALKAAVVLRDCSFRQHASLEERQACRTLMREQALQWRHPERVSQQLSLVCPDSL